MTLIGRFLLAALAAATCASADAEVHLQVETRAGGLAFQLIGERGTGPWLLQHSPDGREWEGLVFLEGSQDGSMRPGIEIQWGVLPSPEAREGFFRALQLAEEDPLFRRFLNERIKWRLLGIDGYQYELHQNFGQISWHGIVNVAGDEVASFETIDLQPPFVEVPAVPTIGRLFDRIADAIEADAAAIDVTWHPVYGFPASCFIDLDPLLADEESGWSINGFTPAP